MKRELARLVGLIGLMADLALGAGACGSGGSGGVAGAAGTTGAGGGAGAAGGGEAGKTGIGGAGVAGSKGAGGASGAGGHGAAGGAGGASVGGSAGGAPDGGVPCTVTTDGGTVACTTQLASGGDNDIYCAIKADGSFNCWASDDDSFLFAPTSAWPMAIAAAPPGLVQVAVADRLEPKLCGVDRSGTGFCWSDDGGSVIGSGLKAMVVSDHGACGLDVAGKVTCDVSLLGAPPATGQYAKVAVSSGFVAALDVTGALYYSSATFPAGTYVDVATNDPNRVAAVRSDGAVVSIDESATPLVMAGSFTRVALDDEGRACGLDAHGEITCWITVSGEAAAPPTDLPAGPFTQIVGAEQTFCALRATGTTACFGDVSIHPPSGW